MDFTENIMDEWNSFFLYQNFHSSFMKFVYKSNTYRTYFPASVICCEKFHKIMKIVLEICLKICYMSLQGSTHPGLIPQFFV